MRYLHLQLDHIYDHSINSILSSLKINSKCDNEVAAKIKNLKIKQRFFIDLS